jgi:hypothetical protein
MEDGGMILAYSLQLARALKQKSPGVGKTAGTTRLYGDGTPHVIEADSGR